MDVQSGRRKNLRLELDKDFYKSLKLEGTEFIGSRIVDISYGGLGLMFEDGVSGVVAGQKVDFTIKFDQVEVAINGIVRHTGSKFVGIEFLHIKSNKNKLFEYIETSIIKKFQIPSDLNLRGLLVTKIDLRITLLIMILEALLLLGGFYIYSSFKDVEKSKQRFLEGYNKQIESIRYPMS